MSSEYQRDQTEAFHDMTVDELIVKLQILSNNGCGNFPIYYGESTVIDSIDARNEIVWDDARRESLDHVCIR